jgi:diguanylate cyclase (GGDEF)-like protein
MPLLSRKSLSAVMLLTVLAIPAWLLASPQVQIPGLTQEEILWLEKHPVIRHAPDPDYAPLESCNSKARPIGIAPAYLALIGKKLGVRFEAKCTSSWAASLDKVRNRQADLVTVATKTAERAKYMLFTSPYITLPDVILVRTDQQNMLNMADLKGKTISVIEGWAANDWIREYYPEIKLKLVRNVETALREVSFGMVDATVLGLAAASHGIEQTKITNLKMAGESGYVYHLSLASRKDWPLLNSILEKALNTIGGKEHDAIMRDWISLRVEGWVPGPVFWVIIGSILIVASITAIISWNMALRRRVAERTQKLMVQTKKLEKAKLELARLASLDGLTNISNRRYLDEYLENEWLRLSRAASPLSLIMIDIDFFKKFNDHYGHLAGDECLVTIAWILRESIRRPADFVARFGGEEFVCLLPDTALEGALNVAQLINQRLNEVALPHASSPVADIVTVSMGLATCVPSHDKSAMDLIELADKQLYQAKEQGRNRIVSASI